MVNYNKGKIYKIECLTTGLIYVGSTTKDYLSQRLAKHIDTYKQYLKGNYNFTRSFMILENNNYRIELLEDVNCESKDQLQAREGYYIRTLECVNKRIEGRTALEYSRQYYQNNQDKIKQYYQDNKDEMNEKRGIKYECSCGSKIRIGDKSTHNKTKKHQAYLETLNN